MTTAASIPTTTGNKQDRRSVSKWRALIRAFSRSGETRTQFCERHGVALSTLSTSRLCLDWFHIPLCLFPSSSIYPHHLI